MNVNLTKHQEVYIRSQMKFGGFANASEVIRDALRIHQIHWEQYYVIEGLEEKLAEALKPDRKTQPLTPAFWERAKKRIRDRAKAKAAT